MTNTNWAKACAVALIAVTVGVISGLTSPANAATLEYNEAVRVGSTETATFNVGWNANYGQVRFAPQGDEIWTWDTAEDGSSVGVWWQTTNGRSGICRNRNGAGGLWSKCNKDFSESAAIRIKIGRCNASATRTCKVTGDWDWTSNWSNYVSVAG